MFNFIFDGKLGDMLAPIKSPVQQFHLAIQHHKHDEVRHLTLPTTSNICRFSGLFHLGRLSLAMSVMLAVLTFTSLRSSVICKCWNFSYLVVYSVILWRYIFSLIYFIGLPVDLKDNHGNTPLHYSAKHGHFDICKYLIDHGASAAARNARGQSPYDVADGNHRVRQYLLPIQLQLERDQFSNMTQAPSYTQQNYYQQTPSAPAAPVTPSPVQQFPPPPYPSAAAQDPIPPSPSPTARSEPSPITLPANPAAPPAPYPPPPALPSESSGYPRTTPPTSGASYTALSTSSRMIQAGMSISLSLLLMTSMILTWYRWIWVLGFGSRAAEEVRTRQRTG